MGTMNKFSWIGYNIDTHTGFIFASDARIEPIWNNLLLFMSRQLRRLLVRLFQSVTSSCGNVTQIMTRYLHLITNSRHSWNSFVFV